MRSDLIGKEFIRYLGDNTPRLHLKPLGRLDFNVHPDTVLPAKIEHLPIGAYRLAGKLRAEPAAGIHCGQLIRGEIGDLADATHGAAEYGVVHQDRHAVARQHDVELDRAVSMLKTATQRRKRIFRCQRAAAAMRDYFGIGPHESSLSIE